MASPNWLLLPTDLVADIALRLESFEDFIRFSAVCRPWNRASSSVKRQWRAKPLMPWLLLAENTQDNPSCVRKIFNLPETFGARCWGSPYGWLAMVGRDLNVQLFNPITKARISFPSLRTLPHLVEPNGREKEGYNHDEWLLHNWLTKLIVLKVNNNNHYEEEFCILILHCVGLYVAFARHGDQSWTSIVNNQKDQVYLHLGHYIKEISVLDAIGMGDHVFALYKDGTIGYWDVYSLFHRHELVESVDHLLGEPKFLESVVRGLTNVYVVQAGSDILLAVRYKEEVVNPEDEDDYDHDIGYETIDFEVYKLNPDDKSLEKIKDLGDFALFVGGNTSMCVRVIEEGPLVTEIVTKSGIYYTDDENSWWGRMNKGGGHDMGVFYIKLDELETFEDEDMHSLICPPTWFIPHFY